MSMSRRQSLARPGQARSSCQKTPHFALIVTRTGRRDARAAVAEEESEEEGAEEEDEVDLAIRAPRGTATKEVRGHSSLLFFARG